MDAQPVIDWLIGGAGHAGDPKETMRRLCLRMVECGIRLHRLALFVRPLHPNVAARGWYWRHDSEEG